MAIDPSIVLGLKPAPVLDIQGALSKAAQYRNLISETAYRDQERQTNAEKQKREKQQYDEADRAAQAQRTEGELMAANTNPDGTVNHQAVVQGLAQAGHGKEASTYATRVQIPDEKARLENQKEKVEITGKKLGILGQVAQSLTQVPDEQLPGEYDRSRQEIINQGLSKPEDIPPAAQIMQRGGLPALRQVVTQHAQQAMTATEQITAHQKDLDYAQKLLEFKQKVATEAPDTAKKWNEQAAQVFSAAQTPEQWQSAQKTLVQSGAPLNIVSQFGEFGPDAPKRAQQLGMSAKDSQESADRAATLAQTKTRDTATATYQQGELANKRAELAQKQGGPLSSLSASQRAIAQKLADGDFNPQELGRFTDKESLLAGAMEINPDWTRQAYATKKAFTDPQSRQSQNLGTVSRIVEHIGRFEKNSDALGLSPSMLTGTNLTGNAAAVRQDAHAISAELEKLVSGGVGTEGQIKSWQSALTSSRADIRKAAIDEISQLVGGQFVGMNQTYKAALGKDLPLDKFTSQDSKEWLRKNGIEVTGGGTGAPVAPIALKDGTTLVPHDQKAAEKFKKDHPELIK